MRNRLQRNPGHIRRRLGRLPGRRPLLLAQQVAQLLAHHAVAIVAAERLIVLQEQRLAWQRRRGEPAVSLVVQVAFEGAEDAVLPDNIQLPTIRQVEVPEH